MSDENTSVRPPEEIVITITEENASYKSSLPPNEIVFWLDLMKHMILTNVVNQVPPEVAPVLE